ncbi:MAG TPA: GvpL/GvpF family gas vesicle protein [Gemmatimonadaceae bacterium]|nr:GvpL/GvpF family gas vesicle protein [Gemmatimonadaceae bacterium]
MDTPSKRMLRVGADAVQLCGVVRSGMQLLAGLADAQFVQFRGLTALVRRVPFAPIGMEEREIAAYRAIVEGAFAERTVLPATYGTVFRSRESLLRWLELHYFTLLDALRFMEGRQMARVHIGSRLADRSERPEEEADIEATALDSFRVLKRSAVAFLPRGARSGLYEASFLVERERWDAFGAALREEERRLGHLRLHCSGPWPPYDFVRMELHG